MESLINSINDLKNSPIKNVISERMSEFASFRNKDSRNIFNELCFCLLTANFQANKSISIQNSIGNGFTEWDEEKLSKTLKILGHRFPNTRAKYIVQARLHKDNLVKILSSFKDDKERREWIVKNIKGLGMKESSHFLRNIGYNNLAIIDFHIIDLLHSNKIIEKPKNKSLTPKKYIEIENILEKICKTTNLTQGELDLYLWYKETGTVLK